MWILSVGQEKAFDRMDNSFIFSIEGFWLKEEHDGTHSAWCIKMGSEGLKVLGVFLGTEGYERKNWKGVNEKACARLLKWERLQPQLSYTVREEFWSPITWSPRHFGTDLLL